MKEYEDAGITVSDKFTTLILLEFEHYTKVEYIRDRQMGIKTVVKNILISDLLHLSWAT